MAGLQLTRNEQLHKLRIVHVTAEGAFCRNTLLIIVAYYFPYVQRPNAAFVLIRRHVLLAVHC